MKRNFIHIVVLGMVLLGLHSCKSSSGGLGSSAEMLSTMATVETVMDNHPDFDTFTSRLKLTVPVNGESSFNGTLKIKKDELIQISLQVPVIRIEAARIEISKDYITVIDRINKRYVHVPVSDLKAYVKTDLDYYALQALFTNSIFVPGKRKAEFGDVSRFSVGEATGREIQLFRKDKGLLYLFDIDPAKAELIASQIRSASSQYGLQWTYYGFAPLAGKSFPTGMSVDLDMGAKTSRMKMDLTRLSTDKEEINPVEIPSKYNKVELDELIKQLLKI